MSDTDRSAFGVATALPGWRLAPRTRVGSAAGLPGGGARGGGLATGRLTRAPKLPAAFGVDGLPLRSNVGDECGDSDDTVEEAPIGRRLLALDDAGLGGAGRN